MCLIKIRKEEDEDDYVPVRRVVRTSREHVNVHRASSPHRRSSKVIAVHRTSEPRISEPRIVVPPPPRPLAVESSPGYRVPPPQPVPIFVQPPPPPPPLAPAAPQTEVHYVHVSPRSSISDHHRHSEDDTYRYRREVRYERDYSPPRDDYYHYRHVEGAPARSRSRRRERSRSRSRGRYDDYDDYSDDGRRRTVRVKRTTYTDD